MPSQAQVSAEDWVGVTARLEQFVEPYVGVLTAAAQRRRHFVEYASGLLSILDRKTGGGIAYWHGPDRKPMQQFVGESPWEYGPLLGELARRVGQRIGEADGVIVFDPSAFAKKGTKSVGVARQWSGRQGKIDNCQVGGDMGVSRREHALVNVRLSLPQEWTKDRARCRAAGVPDDVTFQTRHEQALEMLDESGPWLPHGWVAGDDERGRCGPFREALRTRDERDLLAVPSNTLFRDADAAPPEYAGRGRLRRCRGGASIAGARRFPRPRGPRSTCATARRDRC